MSLNEQQETYFEHLRTSLVAFKEATRRAISVDNNRESHLDTAAAARDEFNRSAAQLLLSLGVPNQYYHLIQDPMTIVTVAPDWSPDTYEGVTFGAHLHRSAFSPPEVSTRDDICLGKRDFLIPRF